MGYRKRVVQQPSQQLNDKHSQRSDLIDSGAPILIGISGGKDSRLVAEQTVAYARNRSHSGRIILLYADLEVGSFGPTPYSNVDV